MTAAQDHDFLVSPREELLSRAYSRGTTVTNCVVHLGLDITERPDDCRLCQADVKNTFRHAIRVNEWLNEWKADAEKLLRGDANATT